MSIFSIILGLIASGFAVHGAGNFKGTWNKPVESYKDTSFFSPEIKKGLDVTNKFVGTAAPALVAIQSFTGDTVKTAALQSVLDVTTGKLPKSGDKLSKTFSDAGDEFKTNFGSQKSTRETKNDQISNIDNEHQESSPSANNGENGKNQEDVSESSNAEIPDNESSETMAAISRQDSTPVEAE